MSWSAAQYGLFENERNRPVRDLLARVGDRVAPRAIDLGCGPGNSTEILLSRFPDAKVHGIDSSEDMIEAARRRLPEVEFGVEDIGRWTADAAFDIVLANAALQWVPGHAALLPRLVAALAGGGCLAVQMPDNLDEPAHRSMREVAADPRWAARLEKAARPMDGRHPATWYYRELRALGTSVDVWRTTYYHPLASARAIVEWFKGSALAPFLAPLDAAERNDFLDRYEHRVAEEHPALEDGTVVLPFPRLFFVAMRPGRTS